MCVSMLSLSVMSDSAILWSVAQQVPPTMGFPRPFPPPEDLPHPGIKAQSPVSPALAGGFFTNVPSGKP